MALSAFLRSCLLLLLTPGILLARSSDDPESRSVKKTATNDDYRAFSINNIFNYYSNNGGGSYNKYTSNSAFEYPKGSGMTAVFQDGFVWAGFHKGQSALKAGGSAYRHALQAGRIVTPGGPTEAERALADDPLKDTYRVFCVRADVTPTTRFEDVQNALQDEASLISRFEPQVTASSLFESYLRDWNEWPARTATDPTGLAPFKDINGNGTYEPGTDIPGQPGADQTLYYVANDLDEVRIQQFMGCAPIGMEVHRTIWGYNRVEALGNMIFSNVLLINKSGAPVDSMFIAQFADADVGDSGDDFAGCDTSRNLGFEYNGRATDATYGKAVPSPGYRLLQGPAVPASPNDSAYFRFGYRKGFKNLGMTTFVFFLGGSTLYGDPNTGPGGNRGWYNLMNALNSAGTRQYINPLTNQPSKFAFRGDPVSNEGWVDGTGGFMPGDRRLAVITGPFTLANGDTQEIVTANVIGLGSDRLSSVGFMKIYSDVAQNLYEAHFHVAQPPTVRLHVTGLDQSISLEWGDPAEYESVERSWGGGYEFQGYNLYQLPSTTFDKRNAARLATYDVVDNITTVYDETYDDETGFMKIAAVQFGTNSGLSRSYIAATDSFKGDALVNGTTYYYALTAYAVNPDPHSIPRSIETVPLVLGVVPESPRPGYRQLAVGDTIKDVTHTSSNNIKSDGTVLPIVIDPTRLTGATYTVRFTGTYADRAWSLVRTFKGRTDTVVNNCTTLAGSIEGFPIVDGIQWSVLDPPGTFKRFLVVRNARGPLSPPEMGTFAFNSNGFPTLNGGSADGVNDRPSSLQQANGSRWGICTGNDSSQNVTLFDSFILRTARASAPGGNWGRILPFDYEIRFTAAGGKVKLAFTSQNAITAPFELWNIGAASDPNDDYRMIPWVNDINRNELFDLDGIDHPISGGDNDPETDWIYWMEPRDTSPGTRGYDAWVASNFDDAQATGPEVMANMVLVNWNGGSVSDPSFPANVNASMPENGTIFRILTSKPNTSSDMFIVHAPAYEYSAELAAQDISRINVYPNPYFGYNTLETSRYYHFVTFTHLPRSAVVRIFDLAGTLVRTLRKDDPSQFLRWDLMNENGYLVGSTIFVVYIEMPELGKVKILKLAVMQEQQWMDRW